MIKKTIQYIALIITILTIQSCDKDNFIDPNDPRYGTVVTDGGIELNFNSTEQTIHHFGASGGFQDQWVGVWPDATREPVAELLFSSDVDANGNPEGIGLSHWRVNIGDGSADQANSGFRSSSWFRETECFLNANGTYDWTKQEGTQWFLNKAREYGVPSFTAWATTPPYFMTSNGYTFRTSGVSGFNCPPNNYDDYSNFLADVMLYYEGQGFNFDVVCPFNETQYLWESTIGDATQSGTFASNSQVANTIRVMDPIFTAKGVQAKIMVPEAGQHRYLYSGTGNTENQINNFFNSSSANYIGDLDNISNHVASHSYFSNNTANQTINQRESTKNVVESYSNLDFWQTEYSLLGTAYQQGLSVQDLEEIDYAIWLARIIHSDLTFGNATGWDFWTALNQSTFGDHPFRFNLILYSTNAAGPNQTNGTFEDVKNLWALGNYSRFVRPGMVRFNVLDPSYTNPESALDNFMISGFIEPNTNEVVLVCVNRTSSNRTLNFAGYGEDFTVQNDTFDAYTTSATEDLSYSTKDATAVSIPAKSIVTLRASLN